MLGNSLRKFQHFLFSHMLLEEKIVVHPLWSGFLDGLLYLLTRFAFSLGDICFTV